MFSVGVALSRGHGKYFFKGNVSIDAGTLPVCLSLCQWWVLFIVSGEFYSLCQWWILFIVSVVDSIQCQWWIIFIVSVVNSIHCLSVTYTLLLPLPPIGLRDLDQQDVALADEW